MTAGEVAEKSGLARATVSSTLSRLARNGDVEKAERGYRLAPAGAPTEPATGRISEAATPAPTEPPTGGTSDAAAPAPTEPTTTATTDTPIAESGDTAASAGDSEAAAGETANGGVDAPSEAASPAPDPNAA